MTNRVCGTCSACCRWPAVPEIDKPARTPCKFLEECGYGCTIYADRPSACTKYRCSWLRGIGAEEDQPDTCHILIDRRRTQWGLVLVAKSLEPGATSTKQGQDTISRAAQESNMLCLIVDHEDTDRVIGAAGPKLLVDEFRHECGEKPVSLGSAGEYIERLAQQIGEGRWPVI